MTLKWRLLAAWSAGLAGFLLSLAVLFILLRGQTITPEPLEQLVSDVTYMLIGIALTLVGTYLAIKRGDNAVSWIVLGAGVSLGLAALLEQIVGLSLVGELPRPHWVPVVWLSQWAWILPYVFLILLLLFYPTGQLPSPRWRWALGAALLSHLVLILLAALSATMSVDGPSGEIQVPNPIGILPPFGFGAFMLVAAIMFGTLALGLLALQLRFRRAGAIERGQIKWLLFSGVLFTALEFLNLPWSGVLSNIVSLGVPAAIAIAILRYHLFDIDVIIRRTTSYAIISTILAGIYLGSIVLLQRLLSPFTGESTPAVVLSTLLIAALFLPIRRRVQDVIDRRFFRKKYDAEKVLAQFAATARDETDLDALTAELLRVIQETMQPESLSIVLFDRGAGETGQDARRAEPDDA